MKLLKNITDIFPSKLSEKIGGKGDNILPVDNDLSGSRCKGSSDNIEQSCFAATRGAVEQNDFSRIDTDIKILKNRYYGGTGAIGFGEFVKRTNIANNLCALGEIEIGTVADEVLVAIRRYNSQLKYMGRDEVDEGRLKSDLYRVLLRDHPRALAMVRSWGLLVDC